MYFACFDCVASVYGVQFSMGYRGRMIDAIADCKSVTVQLVTGSGGYNAGKNRI